VFQPNKVRVECKKRGKKCSGGSGGPGGTILTHSILALIKKLPLPLQYNISMDIFSVMQRFNSYN
jgi:hypothetical protein